jgi:hypothetical protein
MAWRLGARLPLLWQSFAPSDFAKASSDKSMPLPEFLHAALAQVLVSIRE